MYQDGLNNYSDENLNNLNDEDNSNVYDVYNNHFYGYQSSNECSNDIKVLFSL
jgi:hypothetical protein